MGPFSLWRSHPSCPGGEFLLDHTSFLSITGKLEGGEDMRRTYLSLCALVLLITTAFQAQDGRFVVNVTLKAMGAENLRTIQFSGSGSNAAIGQNVSPKSAWPVVRVKSYTRQIDLAGPASYAQLIRIQNNQETGQNEVIPANAS